MTGDTLLDVLARLVRRRVEERAKGLDTLRDFGGDSPNLTRLFFGGRSRLSAGLGIGSLSGAIGGGWVVFCVVILIVFK